VGIVAPLNDEKEEKKMKKLALSVIVLVALALFVIACGGAAPTPTPPAPADIFKTASTAMKDVDSVHIDMTMQMTMTTQGMTLQIPLTLAGDVQNPGRFKGTMTMEMMGQSVRADMVVISPTTYISESTTGSWQTTTAEEAGLPINPSSISGINPDDIEGLTMVGEETIGGRAAYHLTGTVKAAPLGLQESLGAGGDVNLKADYWIDKENSYMLKSVVGGDIAMTGEIEATINMSMVMLFSNYNAPVTIEAPM
jgi:LppX_LprAFG lipoprotein